MYYPGICVDVLRKITSYLNQDNLSPGRDVNSRRPEYEVSVLTKEDVSHGNGKAGVLKLFSSTICVIVLIFRQRAHA
jgi:hypothetical protein